MSDKIKKVLQTPEVPEELKPENISVLLESKGKRKKNIKRTVTGTFAATAACALIVSGSAMFLHNSRMKTAENFTAMNDVKTENAVQPAEESDSAEVSETAQSASAMETAFVSIESYDDIYKQLKKNYRKENFIDGIESFFSGTDKDTAESIPATDDEVVAEEGAQGDFSFSDENVMEAGNVNNAEGSDVYDTLSQVEGIAEADIIKASAECVYYVTDGKLRYVPFDSSTGKFGNSAVTDIPSVSGMDTDSEVFILDMYLSGDRLVVTAKIYSSDYEGWQSRIAGLTGVFVFDVSGKDPAFLQSSFQTGYYSSSRMKDGVMYLITGQSVYYGSIEDEKNYNEYIPCTGESIDTMECIPDSSIYIPRDWECRSDAVSYTNISAIDITDISAPVSAISVAGWSGEMYCSYDNIYTVSYDYSDGTENSLITRFTLEDNNIRPAASGKVSGYVHNQFSMDEYNGFFRIATTSYPSVQVYDDEEDIAAVEDGLYEPVNNVFVLDMDMNTVGSVTGFAKTETVKSVSFNGDTGYVVTYEQTDPLFAIDLSDPYNPVITDEFKITGYSSFLRKWNDDLLFGFGIDATEDAYEVGVKLVMFDVSDNGALEECGYYTISQEHAHGIESPAVYDRKALLYSPQKNIIGFPVYDYTCYYTYEDYDDIYFSDIEEYEAYDVSQRSPVYTYRIFSYENGEFTEKNVITSSGGEDDRFDRGLYIGDYICVFSNHEAVSVNMNTMEETDRVIFD